jgi:hypothetical protein
MAHEESLPHHHFPILQGTVLNQWQLVIKNVGGAKK